MRVLVTGATGFIGGHIVDRLHSLSYNVRCLARNPRRATRLLDMGLDVVFGDLCDRDSLVRACQKVDCVIHCAARVDEWGPWLEFERSTIEGSRNIIQASIASGISRFLHVSTIGVYKRNLLRRDLPPVTECSELSDGSDVDNYSKAKLIAEKESRLYESEIGVTVIRPVTVYGPRDEPTLLRLAQVAKSRIPYFINGYNPIIGMLYVDDLVDLILVTFNSNLAIGKTYNAGPLEIVYLRGFMTTLCEYLGLKVCNTEIPYWLAYLMTAISEYWASITNPTDPPLMTWGGLHFFTIIDQICDITCAREDLGWHPKTTVNEGLKIACNWLKCNL